MDDNADTLPDTDCLDCDGTGENSLGWDCDTCGGTGTVRYCDCDDDE